jgi:dTDP-4-dehydrorhamnose reductase
VKKKVTRVLILGASGMLGNAMLRSFVESPEYESYGSVRSTGAFRLLPKCLEKNLITGLDVENIDSLVNLFATLRPDVVINCIGLIKQHAEADDPLTAIPINAVFPHRLARLCEVGQARLVHMSTDCVFSGSKGMYTEADLSDCNDLYGRSKYLGEVDYPHAITLRTSLIGHELNSSHSLVNWFLAQENIVRGYKQAIFSGLPTVEIAHIVRDFVIPHPELHGLYNVSAEPINKFDLLQLIAEIYYKKINIEADERIVIDRSLDSTRFRNATGYIPKAWPVLIEKMHKFG